MTKNRGLDSSRREFLKTSTLFAGGAVLTSFFPFAGYGGTTGNFHTRISGHLWQYASRFPPTHDTTPILDNIFNDFKYAGIEGVELMDINLRVPNAVENLKAL